MCISELVLTFLAEDLPPPTPLTESVEDTYISMTSAPPPIVHCPQTNNVLGLSVEGAVMHVLKTLEVRIITTNNKNNNYD